MVYREGLESQNRLEIVSFRSVRLETSQRLEQKQARHCAAAVHNRAAQLDLRRLDTTSSSQICQEICPRYGQHTQLEGTLRHARMDGTAMLGNSRLAYSHSPKRKKRKDLEF